MPRKPRNTPETFWNYVNVTTPEQCWNWIPRVDRDGYGRWKIAGKRYGSHRLAYTFTKGPIAEGLVVCHSCDNPSCCNPDHLFVGTQLDNIKDMDAKGRRRHWRKI